MGLRRLFTKLQLSGETPTITDDNLMEFSCADCRKRMNRLGDPVKLVLHRYNFLGEHIEDDIQR